jgi:hypothetical protein
MLTREKLRHGLGEGSVVFNEGHTVLLVNIFSYDLYTYHMRYVLGNKEHKESKLEIRPPQPSAMLIPQVCMYTVLFYPLSVAAITLFGLLAVIVLPMCP